MPPIDPSTDPSKEVLNHGMPLDPENRRIQCCYCGKKVPGFNRLQHHLGGIRGNIVECPNVPEEVKEYFRNRLVVVKVGRLVREVGDMDLPGPSSKRRCSSNGFGNGSHSSHSNVQKPRLLSQIASSENGRSTIMGACSNKEGLNPASIAAKRSVGRFFFENAIDFSAVTSPSFQSMMGFSSNKGEAVHSIPSVRELKGWILEDELSDIENYVKNVRLSWARTGCSILLDGWTDQSGRNLINVVIDCPEGPIYYRSADVSRSKGIDALERVLESVVEDVGVQNVVQIVAYSSSDDLKAVNKKLVDKYRSLFWTVSANHCLSLILDEIAQSIPIKATLEKAKRITQFIYSHMTVLELLRRHISCHDLVRPSKIKSATRFLTLENILLEQINLERMFTSSEWLESPWASTNDGKQIAHLVGDSSFWGEVVNAVKASIPLVRAMSLINKHGEPSLGFIYETMDQIKETISEEFGGKKSRYNHYWDMIDDVWNTLLHSPLHAAGYFLNPRLHFTEDFYSDTEVAGGLLISIVRMVGDQRAQDMLSQQVDLYGNRHGNFQLGIDTKDSLSPAAWWDRYGGHCPDLQKVAIRILSQTCTGVESYELRRDLAEKLLSDTGRNAAEQQKLFNLTYLHYNLKLKQSKQRPKFNIVADQIDPTDDWIVNKNHNYDEARSIIRPHVGTNSGTVEPEEGRPRLAPPKMEH
ncbi:hypothetical protein vseg_020376 [Gypsophila vaccaria]